MNKIFDNVGAGMTFNQFFRRFGMLSIFVVLFIISIFLSPAFFTQENLINILKQTAIICIIACGTTLVMIAGEIDLSSGSVMALAGVIACSVVSSTGNIPLAVLVGLVIGTIFGMLNGLIVVSFKIPSFIMTLASMQIARGIVLQYTNGVPVSNLGNFSVLGQGYFGPIPITVVIMIGVIAISAFLLFKTRFGRYIYAVGGNIEAARASGIKTSKVKFMTFLYAGILAGLGGILLMSRMNSGQPIAGQGYEFLAITAVVLGGISMNGGVGSVYGTVIGAFIVGVLNNIMVLTNVSSYYQQIAQGIIIAFAVILDVSLRRKSGA